MLVKILGVLDILSALLFWLFGIFSIGSEKVVLVIAFYLLIKGILFIISKDIASIFDILCAISIFASLSVSMPKLAVILISLFLIQKGIFSLFA